MGAPMTRAGVLLFGKPSAATPLLGHVAGLHAERIAGGQADRNLDLQHHHH